MKIVVQGHTIETTQIFDVVDLSNYRQAGFEIKLIDKPAIRIIKSIPYERTNSEIREEQEPYDRLMKSVIEQWEQDKTELKVFKL